MASTGEERSTDITLEAINAKLDTLSEQVAALAQLAEEERRRREQWEDLGHDLGPVVNDMYMLAVQQLEEASPYVQLEDLVRFGTRLLRSVRMLDQLLSELENLQDLMHDVSPITHDAFQVMIEKMDALDKAGYFSFFQETMRIVDNIVTNFSPQDVRDLADNIVLILNTVKQLTQPDIMHMLQELTDTYREVEQRPEALDISTLGLLRQIRDPEVRRGLALTMQMLRLISLNRSRMPAGFDRPNGNGYDGKGTSTPAR